MPLFSTVIAQHADLASCHPEPDVLEARWLSLTKNIEQYKIYDFVVYRQPKTNILVEHTFKSVRAQMLG